jgi:hypothetical protein
MFLVFLALTLTMVTPKQRNEAIGGFAEKTEYQESQIIHRDIHEWPEYATVHIHFSLPDHLSLACWSVGIARAVGHYAVEFFC